MSTVIKYVKVSSFNEKDRAYYNKLRQFYTPTRLRKIVPYIKSTSKTLSLRTFDWFSTNYVRDKKLILYADAGGGAWTDKPIKYTTSTRILRVSASYKNALRSYTKRYFDPFKRIGGGKGVGGGGVIKYKWGETHSFDTTLAQLIYFRWVLENNLLDYIIANREKIMAHYKKHNKTTTTHSRAKG